MIQTCTVPIYRLDDSVITSVEVDLPDGTSQSRLLGKAVEVALKLGVRLRGADLWGVILEGAPLRGVNLEGVSLRGADLRGANLEGGNLRGSNLEGANLEGVNLRGANLERAYLGRANLQGTTLLGAVIEACTTLVGDRPLLMTGPIGTEDRIVMMARTNRGLMVKAGCWGWGSVADFRTRVWDERGHTIHTADYLDWADFAEAMLNRHA